MRKFVNHPYLRIAVLCCLLCSVLPTFSFGVEKEAVEEEETFARVFCNYNKLIAGDSCLVSYVVYATSPFRMIEKMSKIKVKNGRITPYPLRRQHLQRVREHGHIYYALLVENFVVKTKDVGTLVLMPRDYKVELSIEEYVDPLDAFFRAPAKVRKMKLKGRTDRFQLNVIAKPMRTTKQMLRSGLEVI